MGTPKKWAAHGLVSVLNLLRHGKAVETENTDALYGLIVIGRQGHSRIARFFLGSTTDRVSEYCHCAVMIVKR